MTIQVLYFKNDFMKSVEFLASMREPRKTPEVFEGK